MLLLRRSHGLLALGAALVVLVVGLLFAGAVVSVPGGGSSPLWLLVPAVSAVASFVVVASGFTETEVATPRVATGAPYALRVLVACGLTYLGAVGAVLAGAPLPALATWAALCCLLGTLSASTLGAAYWMPLLVVALVQVYAPSATRLGGAISRWAGEPVVAGVGAAAVLALLLVLGLRPVVLARLTRRRGSPSG